jgi:hypothetical protein
MNGIPNDGRPVLLEFWRVLPAIPNRESDVTLNIGLWTSLETQRDPEQFRILNKKHVLN